MQLKDIQQNITKVNPGKNPGKLTTPHIGNTRAQIHSITRVGTRNRCG